MKFDPTRRKAMTAMAAVPLAVAAAGPTTAMTETMSASTLPGFTPKSKEDFVNEYTPQMRLKDLRSRLAGGYRGRSDPYETAYKMQDHRYGYMIGNVESLKSVSSVNKARITNERREVLNACCWEERIHIEIENVLNQHPYLRTIQNLL